MLSCNFYVVRCWIVVTSGSGAQFVEIKVIAMWHFRVKKVALDPPQTDLITRQNRIFYQNLAIACSRFKVSDRAEAVNTSNILKSYEIISRNDYYCY